MNGGGGHLWWFLTKVTRKKKSMVNEWSHSQTLPCKTKRIIGTSTRGVAPDRRGTGRTGLRRPRPADTGSATRSPSRGSGRSVFARRRSALTHRLHTRRTDTCTPDGHAGPRARLQKSQRKEVRLDTPARTCAGCFRSRVKKRCLDHARFVPTRMYV